MKLFRLYQVDSFTLNLFRGNLASVVPDADGLTIEQMLAIAREMNKSETAFILSPSTPDHEVWIHLLHLRSRCHRVDTQRSLHVTYGLGKRILHHVGLFKRLVLEFYPLTSFAGMVITVS